MGGGKAFLLQSAGGLGVMGYDNIFINRFTRDPSCREGIQFIFWSPAACGNPLIPACRARCGRRTVCLSGMPGSTVNCACA